MTYEQFQQLAAQGYNRIPLLREILADTETPLSTYLKLGRGRYSYFFESVQGGEKWGRFSIIGLPCRTVLRVTGHQVRVETAGAVVEQLETADPLQFIKQFKARYRVAPGDGEQRFSGGLVGYFGYDTVRYVETGIGETRAADRIGTPDILLMVSEEVVVFDNLRGTISLVVHTQPGDTGEAESAGGANAWHRAQHRLDQLTAQLRQPLQSPPEQVAATLGAGDFTHHFSEQDYQHAVRHIKDYIAAGDVMQVVLSQRMSVPFAGDPIQLYRALRYLNPSPYMVFFDMEDHHVVSSSPEILARVEAGRITVRPLAGTRRRGSTEAEDQALERELLADEKELAEHLMLIDLSRNDAGRVSRIGSVQVSRQMFVERYSHVMHIASIVESELATGKTALDVLRATLPVGTLSGAPKVRAMEIIDELEPEKRGIYGGAMGYLSWNDNMDTAIAIRTAVIKDQTLYLQSGAGIVADSRPDQEWEETQNKAKAIIGALQLAARCLRLAGD